MTNALNEWKDYVASTLLVSSLLVTLEFTTLARSTLVLNNSTSITNVPQSFTIHLTVLYISICLSLSATIFYVGAIILGFACVESTSIFLGIFTFFGHVMLFGSLVLLGVSTFEIASLCSISGRLTIIIPLFCISVVVITFVYFTSRCCYKKDVASASQS